MGVAKDQINLMAAVLHSSPAVQTWPVTLGIVAARETLRGGFQLAFSQVIPGSWKWPSNPAVPTDNFQYTVWMFVQIDGLWHGGGFVQMWQGRSMGSRELPPIFADVDGVPGYRNYWGDPRHLWQEMSDYKPQPGDMLGLMITAGNGRLIAGVTSVAERSNVVLFPITAADEADMVYLEDGGTPPVDPPVDPPAPPVPPSTPALEARLLALEQKLDVVIATLKAVKAPSYDGTVTVPFLGTGKVSLTPKP